MTNQGKKNYIQGKLDDTVQQMSHWGQENVDILTAMSVTAVSIVIFAVTLTKLGPHIESCREKVKRILTEYSEETIKYSDALRYITTGIIAELTYTTAPTGQTCIHLKSVSNARFKAYLVPGSEASLFSLACTHVPQYQARPISPLLSNLVISTFIPALSYMSIRNFLSTDTDETVCTYNRTSLLSKLMPTSIYELFCSSNPADPLIVKPEEPLTFDDVISSAKEELYEIVDLLNNPEIYAEVGASCPRGVLVTGPTGVGKTMLARAVAEEANVNFMSCSASTFVELYVGRGAKRIRQVFKEARKNAPTILFVDELDAFGARRDSDSDRGFAWTGTDEYIQTLNQFLFELDGFKGRDDNVLVIGATNRPRCVDSALIRSGRFDRWISMSLPSNAERYEILKVSVRRRGLKLSQLGFKHLSVIAQRTNGWSGADIDCLINEAAFANIRRRQLSPKGRGDTSLTTPDDLEEALAHVTAARAGKLGLLPSDEQM